MNSSSANEFELWTKIKKGDKNALSCLYEMYADDLYHFGKSFNSDGHLIEDGIHDLFLELYERRKKLPVVRNLRNYLFTILRRKITELSRNKFIIISPNEDATGKIYKGREISTEMNIVHNEEKEKLGLLLSNAIHKLTPKQRRGMTMRFYESKSYEEIASGLDVSIETARTLIYRSLKRMRKNLS